MHVFAVHIRNFRRFSRFTFYPHHGINVIVGPNNSGKTAMLSALDLALNPDNNRFRENLVGLFDFHKGNRVEPIEVWVYLALGGTEAPELLVQFGHRVSRWLHVDKDRLKERASKIGESPFEPAIKLPMDAEAETSEGATRELLAIRFSAKWVAETGAVDSLWEIMDEAGEPRPLTADHRHAIGFILIPAHREPLKMLGFGKRTLLGKLVDDSEVANSLRSVVENIEGQKGPLTQGKSVMATLKTVKETLKDLRLLEGSESYGATLTFLTTEISALRRLLELAVGPVSQTKEPGSEDGGSDDIDGSKEEGFAVPISYQGDGVQNSILLAMLSLSRAEGQQSIVAIEEPERSLEPWRARSLFTKLAGTGASQVFITTHSPSVLAANKTADNLVVLSSRKVSRIPSKGAATEDQDISQVYVSSGSDLGADVKKEFEGLREAYSRCLFSRLVLVVEGASEIGFLPVAFDAAARIRNGPKLDSLGLELLENPEHNKKMELRVKRLGAFGKRAVVLLDHDETSKGEETTEDKMKAVANDCEAVFVWAQESILKGGKGCDLEVIVAEAVPVPRLHGAIKTIYGDPGHDIDETKWQANSKNLNKVFDQNDSVVKKLLNEYLNPVTSDFNTLDESEARLRLLGLMHEPHDIKSSRDWRRLGELIDDDLPVAVLNLYDRLRELLEDTSSPLSSKHYNLHRGEYVKLD
jgi:putative ATP-dependent endonuclease of OLD family